MARKTRPTPKPVRPPRDASRPGRGRRVHDQAARFDRVRRDHSGEIAEDYVQLVAQLIREEGEARTVEIARRLGVSHVTVTKTMARLRREGLIRSEPYRAIYLTRTGAELANKAQARHDLLVRFLRQLGVNAADAENDAEGMEHHVSEATIRAIQAFVERHPA